jgi:hypothetical protein
MIRNTGRTQVWVSWKDIFGEIMSLLIPPDGGPQINYFVGREGEPFKTDGSVTASQWPKEDNLKPRKTIQWRSRDEQQQANLVDLPPLPPLITGFVISPVKINSKQGVPIAFEVESQLLPASVAQSKLPDIAFPKITPDSIVFKITLRNLPLSSTFNFQSTMSSELEDH